MSGDHSGALQRTQGGGCCARKYGSDKRETDRQTEERMATLVQSADMETLAVPSNTGASPTSSGPPQHFNDGKFYLLVVIGEITTEDHLKCAIADIEKGKQECREVGAERRKLTNLTPSRRLSLSCS